MWAYRRRIADAECAIAELKNEHALDRARCRGTGLFHVQLLLGCTALNLKRLTARGQAAEGQAAAPNTGHRVTPDAAHSPLAPASRGRPGPRIQIAAAPPAIRAAPPVWTLTLSLN